VWIGVRLWVRDTGAEVWETGKMGIWAARALTARARVGVGVREEPDSFSALAGTTALCPSPTSDGDGVGRFGPAFGCGPLWAQGRPQTPPPSIGRSFGRVLEGPTALSQLLLYQEIKLFNESASLLRKFREKD